MRLWTEAVHRDWGGKCAVCGSETSPNAHHLENRNVCRALRYDPLNGILLCPSHHKFGKDSAHKGGIWFAEWLREHYPERMRYVLDHRNDDINLEDREVLARIESDLRGKAASSDGACPETGCCGSPENKEQEAPKDASNT